MPDFSKLIYYANNYPLPLVVVVLIYLLWDLRRQQRELLEYFTGRKRR